MLYHRLDFNEFEKKLDVLSKEVFKLTCEKQQLDDTKPIFYEVAQRLEECGQLLSDCRTYFLNFSKDLLEIKNGIQLENIGNFKEICARYYPEYTGALADAGYVEYLTATSLALYFLGQPFSQPWARALKRVKISVGGLPNGACVGKAIGEIVRSARIANLCSQQHAEPLLVYSHMPIVLFKSYISNPREESCLPTSAHTLGRCYELFQLRLYANEGLPFRYFIPSEFIDAKLNAENGTDPNSARKAALEWMRNHAFRRRSQTPSQFVVPIKTNPLSPVFLNDASGIITSSRTPDERSPSNSNTPPLPATFVRKSRMRLYRTRLMDIEVDGANNLLDNSGL